jgi:hypothetical protein
MTSSAYAAPKPAVGLTLPHAVSEGAPISFSWKGRHLGRNHRLVIQRPVGTAHTWKTMMKLSGNSGSGELPGVALGKYRYRLADLAGHRVVAKQTAGVAVFGQVSFSTLFGGENHVYVTPTSSFPYVRLFQVRSWEGSTEPTELAFTVEHNHCSSVHIAFVLGEGPYNVPSAVGVLTLVQESADPVSASAPYNTIGSLDAGLVPGQTWAVNISTKEQSRSEGFMSTYINGYAICDSTEPFSS